MMNQKARLVSKIKQKDAFNFVIEWNDQKISEYRLSDLQRACSCASCRESSVKKVNDDVQAVQIVNVGRYGLKITFTSGCSLGIYSYDFLYEFSGAVS